MPTDLLTAIRAYLKQQRAYGRDDFQAMIEARTNRFAGVQGRRIGPSVRGMAWGK